ncbi:MAG TPA: 3-isopropylmalate dehydratase large subunit [Thermoplasmata archaeon]|nr:3-isopropylmalate dehydratase large subunit [Thermoplasmata archaeon]
MAGHTMTEKILARASRNEVVHAGQIVDGYVDLLYMHEMLALALKPFDEIGIEKVWDPSRCVVTIDHWVPPPTLEVAKMHQAIREFCWAQGIQRFHDVGDHGIVHQLVVERGYVHPGELVIACDSHTNMAGAMGAFAAGIGATETAAVMATGKLWLKVPETLNVTVHGKLARRTGAKDVILKVIQTTGDDGAAYKAVEFRGATIQAFPMNERFVLSNMTTEMGAKAGMIPSDGTTKAYLEAAGAGAAYRPLDADPDAPYLRTFDLDVEGMGPQVACPDNPANVKPIEEVAGTKIDMAFLGSCTNARIQDLRAAAEILKGERVASHVRMIVTPASQAIYRQAVKEGLAEIFLEAGATFTSSTCGPCFGGHMGVLAPKEVCISSTNRNYPGRMGSPEAQVYLASPYTVAASALYGRITDPRGA